MPIILRDGSEAEIPRDIPKVRKEWNIPGGVCFGCYLGDCDPAMHDVPDACEYLGGFVLDLGGELL